MSTNTTEAALEACIERHLTGGESVMSSPGGPMSDDVGVYQTSKGAGYLRGKSMDFNSEFAIDEGKFWQFLESRRRRKWRSSTISRTGNGRFSNGCTGS